MFWASRRAMRSCMRCCCRSCLDRFPPLPLPEASSSCTSLLQAPAQRQNAGQLVSTGRPYTAAGTRAAITSISGFHCRMPLCPAESYHKHQGHSEGNCPCSAAMPYSMLLLLCMLYARLSCLATDSCLISSATAAPVAAACTAAATGAGKCYTDLLSDQRQSLPQVS